MGIADVGVEVIKADGRALERTVGRMDGLEDGVDD